MREREGRRERERERCACVRHCASQTASGVINWCCSVVALAIMTTLLQLQQYHTASRVYWCRYLNPHTPAVLRPSSIHHRQYSSAASSTVQAETSVPFFGTASSRGFCSIRPSQLVHRHPSERALTCSARPLRACSAVCHPSSGASTYLQCSSASRVLCCSSPQQGSEHLLAVFVRYMCALLFAVCVCCVSPQQRRCSFDHLPLIVDRLEYKYEYQSAL